MKIGFKGTDRHMNCRGYQFELGKTYFIDDNKELQELKDGYSLIKNNVELCSKEATHYCNELETTFKHYNNNGKNECFKENPLNYYYYYKY